MKPDTTMVFSFAVQAPTNCLTRDSMSAIEQLKIWKVYQDHWCEHKPSVTISVKEDEWLSVGAWVYENFDSISGISFLPHSDHVYKQAPYQECTEEEYKELATKMPEIDWTKLKDYEKEDYTVASQELACTGNTCEVV
jgi:ribonucleoside-diphosphate reductase alpha chain